MYRIRLEDAAGRQWRESVVSAPSEALARAIVLRSEIKQANFSLLPSEPQPPAEPEDTGDANVMVAHLEQLEAYAPKAAAYPGQFERARVAFEELRAGHGVTKDGKAFGPTKRGRAHIWAHVKAEPWEVVSVESFEYDIEQLVYAATLMQADPARWKRALKALEAQGIPLAVVTGSMFGLQAQKQLDGSAPIVWGTATMKTALTSSAWTPDQDVHDFFNDVTNEVAASGTYVAGGLTLASKTSNYTSATDLAWLDAADFSATGTTITARRAVVYSDTGGASSTDPTWGWLDFGSDVSTSAGTFGITWDPTGILTLDVT